MNNIQNLLNNFIIDPQNPENNYNLAIYYENIGQTASALSYYLRTAEDRKIKYYNMNVYFVLLFVLINKVLGILL